MILETITSFRFYYISTWERVKASRLSDLILSRFYRFFDLMLSRVLRALCTLAFLSSCKSLVHKSLMDLLSESLSLLAAWFSSLWLIFYSYKYRLFSYYFATPMDVVDGSIDKSRKRCLVCLTSSSYSFFGDRNRETFLTLFSAFYRSIWFTLFYARVIYSSKWRRCSLIVLAGDVFFVPLNGLIGLTPFLFISC